MQTAQDDIDAGHKLIASLAEAPSNVQPLLTSLASHARPELHEGHLYLMVPYESVKQTVMKARTIHRTDILASVLILSMTMAATVVGVLFLFR